MAADPLVPGPHMEQSEDSYCPDWHEGLCSLEWGEMTWLWTSDPDWSLVSVLATLSFCLGNLVTNETS